MFSAIDAMSTAQVRQVRATFTQQRMSTYDRATSAALGSERTRTALKLYLWNAEIASAFMVPLHLCEVAIRNAAADAIASNYGSRWPWSAGFRRALPTGRGYDARADLIGRSTQYSSTSKVIPELKFVFWQKMFTSRYDAAIWNHQLTAVLPSAPAGDSVDTIRTRVYEDLDRIRLLRNRIAHHEPIFNRDPSSDLDATRDLLALRCTEAADLITATERVSALILLRP